MKVLISIVVLVSAIAVIAGCSHSDNQNRNGESTLAVEALSAFEIPVPHAPGIDYESNDFASIDYSNVEYGYVIAEFTEKTDIPLKVIVVCPFGEMYIYPLRDGGFPEIIPLTEGSGEYKIGIYENIGDENYKNVISVTIDVMLIDDYLPFIHPNQFVNFNKDSELVALAAELTKDAATVDEKIAIIYNFVVENFTYDYELAESVQTGYLPMLDEVLNRRKGICFDYSALVTAMLRSQGIPARLEIGYHGDEYHAWISKLCDVEGWIEHRYHHNGEEWYRMDPTVESGARRAHRSRVEARDDDTYLLMFNY